MAHIGFERPLEGTKVLDLSRLLPGPFCSLLLADMGADVIRVEAPTGGDYTRWHPPLVGGVSAFFASINRGKRSIALDLKSSAGRDALLRLAAGADVLVASSRPGVAERLGVGYDTLRGVNPALVYCAITGFGYDTDYAARAGHDLGFAALSGVLEQNGEAGGAPQILGAQVADIGGGALYATSAICAALIQRARSNKGAFLDISMTEGALSFHLGVQAQIAAGEPAPRGATMLTGALPCYRIYETRDGGYLSVGGIEAKFWNAFVDAIGLSELRERGTTTGQEAEEVAQIVSAHLRSRSRDEWVSLLADVDCCVEAVLSPEDVRLHPLHRARGVFFEIPTSEAAFPQTATPLTPRWDAAPTLGPPLLGEHSEEVLREAGFSSEEIHSLEASGAMVRDHGSRA